ncbi:alpha-glucosidase [Podospora fimiseda]|uniref:Alpha-glucosidase n=1 Tax=Podospora fimiseda TaxID=252190 RepID=A0AAN7BMN9_9PEZI|nr:alpha-glucosidase [Podospora fimiseda]
MATKSTRPWWKDAVCYQIYPASFKDSNGDGLGDIPGILSKVDYLKDLGVDVIWVSPMFDSPQVDMGYDISNYESVYPPYGTVKDMEELIDAVQSRGMKIILDLVINHTSDQHAWFQESRSSKTNLKRDWYVWKPPRHAPDGTRLPPTNWRSYFSGSTWEYDDLTREYYLHLFAKEQPDLNWENEETRKAIYNSTIRFWLDKGIDGFRVDVVNMYSKELSFKDAPITDPNSEFQPAWENWANGPRIHEFLREINREVLDKYDRDLVMVGELPHTSDPKKVLDYVGSGDKQLSMVFQFDIVDLGQSKDEKYHFQEWKLPQFKGVVEKWQKFMEGSDGWTTAFCENHDQGRSISRYTSDSQEHRVHSGKMLSLLMCSLTGTLFVYQGQEIGMINVPKSWGIDSYQDIESVNFYNTMAKQTNNDPAELEYIMKSLQILSRDNARIPMQWDSSEHAGFSSKKPWARVHDLYKEINVQQQQKDKNSVLEFWKRMIKLRKEFKEVLVYGEFEGFKMDDERTFIFGKKDPETGTKRAVVVCNFTGEDQEIELPGGEYGRVKFLVGSYEDAEEKESRGR